MDDETRFKIAQQVSTRKGQFRCEADVQVGRAEGRQDGADERKSETERR
jgi:hypothetical protein